MNSLSKVIPIRAQALSPEAKAGLEGQVASFQAERAMLGRSAIRAGWIIGGIGVAIGLAGMVCAASLFPLKTHDVEYIVVERSSGYIGPAVSAKDAPEIFSDTAIEGVLQQYVEMREAYVYETDAESFHRVTLMSAPDEQARYKEMHDAPLAPARALRDKGYIRVDNFRYSSVGDGKAKTRVYLVRFDRWEMRSGQPVPTRGEPYSATIHFQFHPEYPMRPADRRKNPSGLYVLAYQPKAENPTGRTN